MSRLIFELTLAGCQVNSRELASPRSFARALLAMVIFPQSTADSAIPLCRAASELKRLGYGAAVCPKMSRSCRVGPGGPAKAHENTPQLQNQERPGDRIFNGEVEAVQLSDPELRVESNNWALSAPAEGAAIACDPA